MTAELLPPMSQSFPDASLPDAARAALVARLGPRGFVTDAERIAPWLTDWRGRFHGKAAALIEPGSVDQLSAALAIAHAHRLPVVPQGGNSGMSAGATPDASGAMLLLSLRRLNAVGPVDGRGRMAAGAGAILQHVQEAAEAAGRRFPLTLGGRGSATVGGLIATNAGGTQVLRHGTMRAQVAGLDVVLADGRRLDLMAELPKDNRGFDPRALFIGSEGTLGIVAAARLRTVPALVDRAVGWAGTDSPTAAARLLDLAERQVARALEGFEIVPDESLAAVLRHIPGTRTPLAGRHRWHVLVELVRDDPDATAPQAMLERLLSEALGAGMIADATVAPSEAAAEAFWKLRDSISEAERAEGPAVQHDISVQVAAMPRFIEAAVAAVEARFPGTAARAFGHLGDGNVHFHVRAPAGVAPGAFYRDAAAPISRFVHDLVIAEGGSISAEHGIGRMKQAEHLRTTDPVRLAVLAGVKAALDPHGILNPGVLVPSSPDIAAAALASPRAGT